MACGFKSPADSHGTSANDNSESRRYNTGNAATGAASQGLLKVDADHADGNTVAPLFGGRPCEICKTGCLSGVVTGDGQVLIKMSLNFIE